MKFKMPSLNKQRMLEVLKKRWGFFLLEIVIFAGLIALDLTMKDFLYNFLLDKPSRTYTLIPGFLDLYYTTNTGAGFGTLKGNTVFLTVITAIVIVVIFFFMVFNHKEGESIRIPLVMIAAGGIGNLIDRIALGYVRDFFEFTFVKFAIFNVADICVTVGAIILIISLIVVLVKEGQKNKKSYEKSLADAVNTAEDSGEKNASDNSPILGDGKYESAKEKNAFSVVLTDDKTYEKADEITNDGNFDGGNDAADKE